MADPSPLSRVTDTLFAMIANYVANGGSRDLVGDFPTIPKEAVTGHRTFTFEGQQFYLASRTAGDYLIFPGVNVYFGDSIAINRKILPQIWRMPVMMHLACPLNKNPRAAEKQAFRLGELVQNAWEGLGGTLQIYDFTISPPEPVVGRFVTWATSTRGSWRDAGDPTTDDFTNRIWTMEVRYTR